MTSIGLAWSATLLLAELVTILLVILMLDVLLMGGSASPGLKPTLGLWALIVYGVGDILGAGIYAVVGEVAQLAGYATWLSFLAAMTVAMLTALSYAELGGRFSSSGGASYFCQRAFRRPEVPLMIGWLVLCSGLVSMAAGSHAFARYLQAIWPELEAVPASPIILGFLLLLGIINFSGMQLSSATNVVCTTLELSGLLVVVFAGSAFVMRGDPVPAVPIEQEISTSTYAILTGAALAFFSFIGFEDIVNVSEEVKDSKRNVPRAIIAALLISGVVYLAVILVTLRVINPAESIEGPLLVEVVRRGAPAFPTDAFAVIAMFAIANTALLNFIMGSRLLYGMSRQRLLPTFLGTVHASRRTPFVAIIVVFSIALVLALSGGLKTLAGTTSLLLLSVFSFVHVALIVIKRRDGQSGAKFEVPTAVPVIGLTTTVGLMAFSSWESFVKFSILVLIGVGIILVHLLVRGPHHPITLIEEGF